jgi:hypothetical protein
MLHELRNKASGFTWDPEFGIEVTAEAEHAWHSYLSVRRHLACT